MAVSPEKQQFSINDDREIVEKVDRLANELSMSRVTIYAAAIRMLLKNPHANLAKSIKSRANKEDS